MPNNSANTIIALEYKVPSQASNSCFAVSSTAVITPRIHIGMVTTHMEQNLLESSDEHLNLHRVHELL